MESEKQKKGPIGLDDGAEKSESSKNVGTKETQKSQKLNESLTFSLSQTLVKKLKSKALSEGVSPEELVSELISEGLVLRAWEIMERKSAMKSSNTGVANNRPRNNFRGNNSSGFTLSLIHI